MLLIDDIDWLDLSHKHGLLGSIVAEGPPRTNRVSIVFTVFSLVTVFLDDHWDYLEMVEVVQLLLLLSEILNYLASHEIPFQFLNIIFDIFGFVGDGKVEGVVPQAEV